jgi:D-alanyl-D-alanine carboxypeptidase/D-alanyl-D-alanine-endopeptidase (penicillin-binding protein 4)
MWQFSLKDSILPICLLLTFGFLTSCKSTKPLIQKAEPTNFNLLIDTSSVLNSGFTGLVIYDLKSKKTLFDRNGSKLFTPASNVKLMTLYASLKTLSDSIPAIKYIETDTSFIFWGMGDPTFLHPFFEKSRTLEFLREKGAAKKMYFSTSHNQMAAYGKGWMWDDYNDYYQAEIATLPMYGNVLTVRNDSSGFMLSPNASNFVFGYDSLTNKIQRELDENIFKLPIDLALRQNFYKEVPYKNVEQVNFSILKDSLNQNLELIDMEIPTESKLFYSLTVDTVYKRMMEISDNIIAEQLLLVCGMMISDTFSTRVAIRSFKDQLFDSLCVQPVWVDGSGLSRYNMVAPWTLIKLLEKMKQEFPEERLYNLLAQGGKNGTLGKMFMNESGPVVYGKSGSISGVYNLCGFLITKSGKTIAFSFMNNNMNAPVSSIKKEVENILIQYRNEY